MTLAAESHFRNRHAYQAIVNTSGKMPTMRESNTVEVVSSLRPAINI